MQIGYVTSEVMKVGDESKTWTKMTLRPPFGRQQDYKLVAHKKTKDTEPDFDIYLLVNNRGEKFRNPKVGALWVKMSEKNEKYMSGNIETPMSATGLVYIAVTKAKPLYEGEEVSWTHDVLWSNPSGQKQNNKPSDSEGGGEYTDTPGGMSADEVNALLNEEAKALFRP